MLIYILISINIICLIGLICLILYKKYNHLKTNKQNKLLKSLNYIYVLRAKILFKDIKLIMYLDSKNKLTRDFNQAICFQFKEDAINYYNNLHIYKNILKIKKISTNGFYKSK